MKNHKWYLNLIHSFQATAAAEVITDRTCIFSNGTINFHYSIEDLISCCEECGDGCNGGHPEAALLHWITIGVVSGGPYHSHKGCLPYEIPPSEKNVSGSHLQFIKYSTPACHRKCESSYPKSYYDDKRAGSKAYKVLPLEKDIKFDILTTGPVTALMFIYEDFLHYKSGVYHHFVGDFRGKHVVKIIGWGIENDIPYWLIANSWNYGWGENGYFKIRRGSNECHIEINIVTGIP